jgi:hypothetical protein
VADVRKPQLRLLKVVVQATFVVDDGESLTEQVAAPVTVSAAEWPAYATETFPQQVAALEQQMAEEMSSQDSRSEPA